MDTKRRCVKVGVLALQGAFSEHVQLLRDASKYLHSHGVTAVEWSFVEVRMPEQLAACDALVIPGGESTTMSLVAARTGLLEPLRNFVKLERKPTWGTCAGLILLAEAANRTKKGGQELIGGLDVCVDRNHFGRQVESFEADLSLPFLETTGAASTSERPFRSVFIRAPVVQAILEVDKTAMDKTQQNDIVVAPPKAPTDCLVEVLARLPKAAKAISEEDVTAETAGEAGDIIAVRQGNVFGTSFHPELTGDPRIHIWWLQQVLNATERL